MSHRPVILGVRLLTAFKPAFSLTQMETLRSTWAYVSLIGETRDEDGPARKAGYGDVLPNSNYPRKDNRGLCATRSANAKEGCRTALTIFQVIARGLLRVFGQRFKLLWSQEPVMRVLAPRLR